MTKDAVAKEFLGKLRALLDEYSKPDFPATITMVNDHRGEYDHIEITIPGIYTKNGDTVREYTEIDIGREF